MKKSTSAKRPSRSRTSHGTPLHAPAVAAGPTAAATTPVATGTVAVYPGTFDPITNGHLDILERALRLFDSVIVTLAVNPRKSPLFTVEERIAFIANALPAYRARLQFASFSGLLVDFCRERKAKFIVRGLRALADFEYEFQFAHMNRRLAPGVDTMFFMTDENNHYVSSSLVKEVASLGGDVSGLVPPAVEQALQHKYRSQPLAAPQPGPRERRARRPRA